LPQQTQTSCSCPSVEVIDNATEPTIEIVGCSDCDCSVIEVTMPEEEPVVEVLIQGARGAKGDKGDKGDSFNDTPFDFDPVQIYLNARDGE